MSLQWQNPEKREFLAAIQPERPTVAGADSTAEPKCPPNMLKKPKSRNEVTRSPLEFAGPLKCQQLHQLSALVAGKTRTSTEFFQKNFTKSRSGDRRDFASESPSENVCVHFFKGSSNELCWI